MHPGECFVEVPTSSGGVLVADIGQISELFEGVLSGSFVLDVDTRLSMSLQEFVVFLGDQVLLQRGSPLG